MCLVMCDGDELYQDFQISMVMFLLVEFFSGVFFFLGWILLDGC